MRTADLFIEGMVCGNCAKKIQSRLGALDGIRVKSIQKGRARVTYDETRISIRDLEQAVSEAGYSVSASTTVPDEGN